MTSVARGFKVEENLSMTLGKGAQKVQIHSDDFVMRLERLFIRTP